jgi:4-oxalmesaconate hydratase
MHHIYFDTCVYYQPGLELLIKAVGVDNVLFASEMIGAVREKDPITDTFFDDTKRYIDAITWLTAADRQKLFEFNARTAYPRLDRVLSTWGSNNGDSD